MHLALDELVCTSLIRGLGGDQPSKAVPVGIGADTVHVCRASNVLYIPQLKLQVVEDRIVPLEAIAYAWYLDLEKRITFGTERAAPYRQEFAVHERQEDVCILSNFYSRVFAHSVDELIKVIILERHGFEGTYVFSNAPKYSIELLKLVGVPESRIVTDVAEATIFRSCYYSTPLNREDALNYPDVFLELRRTLLAAAGKESSFGRRLWMTRGVGAQTTRRNLLVNEEEIYQCLNNHGFQIIDPGSMPVASQIATMRNAEVISGPHGSAFIHSMFMDEGSTVVECFSPNRINPSIIELCRLLKHRYFMLVDTNTHSWRYPHGEHLSVNCSHLELVLGNLERER